MFYVYFNNTTFKSRIRPYDYLRVYSLDFETPHMYPLSSFHILENINKQSLHVERSEKKEQDRRPYLITKAAFVKVS